MQPLINRPYGLKILQVNGSQDPVAINKLLENGKEQHLHVVFDNILATT